MIIRVFFVAFILLLFQLPAAAQEDSTSIRPKVGVVLSGGGAKGFAHIGLLKKLEEKQIPIDYICGTSIGSIVGGLYALGYDASSLEKLVKEQDWDEILSDNVSRRYRPFSEKDEDELYFMKLIVQQKKTNALGSKGKTKVTLPSGAMYGQNIMNLFSELSMGYHNEDLDFSKLPIPFFCIAADMITGEEIILDKGFLPEAIRASMSIPTAFAPVEWNDTLRLVDGGIVNNFPTDVCREKGADIIIGCDIRYGLRSPEEVNSIPNVVNQMITLMGNEKGEKNKKLCDVYVRPQIKDYSASSFDSKSATVLIERGEIAAREVEGKLDSIKSILESYNTNFAPKPEKFVVSKSDSILISDFEVLGLYSGNEENLLSNMELILHHKTTMTNITDGVKRVFGNRHYQYVQFRIIPLSNGSSKLQLKVNEKEESEINMGVHMDSDQDFSIVMNYNKRHNLAPGARFSVDANIFGNAFLHAQYSEDRGIRPGIFINFNIGQRSFSWVEEEYDNEYDIFHTMLSVGTHMLLSNSVKFEIGVQGQYLNYNNFQQNIDSLNVLEGFFMNYFAQFSIDRLDRKYFPSKGWKFDTKMMIITDDFVSVDGHHPTFILSGNWMNTFRFSDRFVIIPSLTGRVLFDNTNSFTFKTRVGGPAQTDFLGIHVPFYGAKLMEHLEENIIVGASKFRFEAFDKTYISLTGNAAVTSQSNWIFNQEKYVFGGALEIAYDSHIGPIQGSLEYSTYDDNPFIGYSFGFRF